MKRLLILVFAVTVILGVLVAPRLLDCHYSYPSEFVLGNNTNAPIHVSAQIPSGKGIELVLGTTNQAGFDDSFTASLYLRTSVFEGRFEIGAFDLTFCNWLDRHGQYGAIINCRTNNQKLLLDHILGPDRKLYVEFTPKSAQDNYTLWLTYITSRKNKDLCPLDLK